MYAPYQLYLPLIIWKRNSVYSVQLWAGGGGGGVTDKQPKILLV